jgi:hypothetical protein
MGVVEVSGGAIAGVPPEVAARLTEGGLGLPAAVPLPERSDLAGAIERTAHIVPPSPAEVIEVLGAEVAAEVLDAVVEGEVLDPVDPHGVVGTRHSWGAALVCRCGEWEAAVTGPGSLRWAQGDHRRHVEQATAAAGDD